MRGYCSFLHFFILQGWVPVMYKVFCYIPSLPQRQDHSFEPFIKCLFFKFPFLFISTSGERHIGNIVFQFSLFLRSSRLISKGKRQAVGGKKVPGYLEKMWRDVPGQWEELDKEYPDMPACWEAPACNTFLLCSWVSGILGVWDS